MTNISTWAYKYQTLESVEQFTLPLLISQWKKKQPNQTKKVRTQRIALKLQITT
jgi:hypothetical protein